MSLNTGLKTSCRFFVSFCCCFFKSINEFPVNPQHHLEKVFTMGFLVRAIDIVRMPRSFFK